MNIANTIAAKCKEVYLSYINDENTTANDIAASSLEYVTKNHVIEEWMTDPSRYDDFRGSYLHAQTLMECIIARETDLTQLDPESKFGANFAKLCYFINHDNTSSTRLMDPDGIDVLFQINQDINKRFKQYMTEVFPRWTPTEDVVALKDECLRQMPTTNAYDKWQEN